MSQSFDPTGMAYLMPNQQPSPAQLRFLSMWKLATEEFKGEDQFIVMTPISGPEAVKCLSCEHAAQVVYDKQGRLATPEQVKEYKMKNELARQDVQKQIDRQDLAKSVQRVLRD